MRLISSLLCFYVSTFKYIQCYTLYFTHYYGDSKRVRTSQLFEGAVIAVTWYTSCRCNPTSNLKMLRIHSLEGGAAHYVVSSLAPKSITHRLHRYLSLSPTFNNKLSGAGAFTFNYGYQTSNFKICELNSTRVILFFASLSPRSSTQKRRLTSTCYWYNGW